MKAFNRPYMNGREKEYIEEVYKEEKFQSNGTFDKKVSDLLKRELRAQNVFLVHSCTAALEIAALALDIEPGDEIILPSFTYVSTGNSFALRGAKLVFVDVNPRTMCIDLDAVMRAITPNTKVVVPVHYAGVSCDMNRLMMMSEAYGFAVVEDAAQSMFSKCRGQSLGTIGHFGCISCHETKNIHAGGEGGILLINDEKYLGKVQLILEKGTDRQAFLNSEVSRYTWKSLGSSYGMSQLNAAFLYGQLQTYEDNLKLRRNLYNQYNLLLEPLKEHGLLVTLEIPEYIEGNGHMFYIKLSSKETREELRNYMIKSGYECVTHYEPLHMSDAGMIFGSFHGEDCHTVQGAERLLRLPMHHEISEKDVMAICNAIKEFYNERI